MYVKKLKLPVDGFYMEGELCLPVKAESLIIFANGDDGSQSNIIDRQIARYFQKQGFGTLLFNITEEIEGGDLKETMNLNTQRLISITMWLASHSEYNSYDLAYFGTGTGAEVALRASSQLPLKIKAIISLGGRFSANMKDLNFPNISSPTLFIVGELDFQAIKVNRQILKKLICPKQMVVVPGASHLFEESGKLELVAKDAFSWFQKFLTRGEIDPELTIDFRDIDYEQYDD